MKKIVLIFGLISGAICAGSMLITLPLADSLVSNKAEVIGYTTIVLSALIIFFGIRSYRENVASGRITFTRGMAVGLLISLISCACYVGTWEFVYFKLRPDFGAKYAAAMVERAKNSGASQQKLDAMKKQMEEFKVKYDQPLYNIGLTFLEVFPIELRVTLLSAAILRKKAVAKSPNGQTAVVAG
jgi:hypothetical protein